MSANATPFPRPLSPAPEPAVTSVNDRAEACPARQSTPATKRLRITRDLDLTMLRSFRTRSTALRYDTTAESRGSISCNEYYSCANRRLQGGEGRLRHIKGTAGRSG